MRWEPGGPRFHPTLLLISSGPRANFFPSWVCFLTWLIWTDPDAPTQMSVLCGVNSLSQGLHRVLEKKALFFPQEESGRLPLAVFVLNLGNVWQTHFPSWALGCSCRPVCQRPRVLQS